MDNCYKLNIISLGLNMLIRIAGYNGIIVELLITKLFFSKVAIIIASIHMINELIVDQE